MKHNFSTSNGNAKTGEMFLTSTDKKSCPSSCPLKNNGCYAENSHCNIQWERIAEQKTATDLDGLCRRIKALNKNELFRLNEKGDLPQLSDNIIDVKQLNKIVNASKGKRGFTYTHYPMSEKINRDAVKSANENGLIINLSANNLDQADEYVKLNIAPVVVILPLGAEKVTLTKNNNKIVLCPADKEKNITCKRCQLCENKNRDYIIGFESHGTRKRIVDLIAKG